MAKLDGMNSELLTLKVTGGAATSSLNQAKEELAALLTEEERCNRDMELRQVRHGGGGPFSGP